MKFDGTIELEDVTLEEVWLALSDPVMIKQSLPGCQFLVEVGDDDVDFDALQEETAEQTDPDTLPVADPETVAERAFEQGDRYATRVQIGVGSVKPTFDAFVTIDRRDYPEMDASGTGDATNSSFEMESGMVLEETDAGVTVDWWAETEVFGRIAQMGQRVLNPVANQVINKFFGEVETRLGDISEDDTEGLTERVRGLF